MSGAGLFLFERLHQYGWTSVEARLRSVSVGRRRLDPTGFAADDDRHIGSYGDANLDLVIASAGQIITFERASQAAASILTIESTWGSKFLSRPNTDVAMV